MSDAYAEFLAETMAALMATCKTEYNGWAREEKARLMESKSSEISRAQFVRGIRA